MKIEFSNHSPNTKYILREKKPRTLGIHSLEKIKKNRIFNFIISKICLQTFMSTRKLREMTYASPLVVGALPCYIRVNYVTLKQLPILLCKFKPIPKSYLSTWSLP